MTGAPLLPTGLRSPGLLGGGDRERPVAAPVLALGGGRDRLRVLAPGIDLPDLGPCLHQPVLLVLLFDNSPSVSTMNDAIGRRFAESAMALDQFRQRCDCGRALVAVRTFDRRTSSDVGPFTLDGPGWQEVTGALTIPAMAGDGGSQLRPSLRKAEWLTHRYPRHRPALVVFSDFDLFDWFPSLVLDRLCGFPGRVHAIVLGAEAPPRLLASSVAISRITPESRPGGVARAIVAALADSPTDGPVR